MATATDAIKPVMDLAVATAAKVAALEAKVSALEAKGSVMLPGAVVSPPPVTIPPELSFWVKPADADIDTKVPLKPSTDPVEIKRRALYGYSLWGNRTRFGKYYNEAWTEINKLFATPARDLPYWKNGRYNKIGKVEAAYLLLTHYNFIAGGNQSVPDYAFGKDLDAIIAADIADYKLQHGPEVPFDGRGPSGN